MAQNISTDLNKPRPTRFTKFIVHPAKGAFAAGEDCNPPAKIRCVLPKTLEGFYEEGLNEPHTHFFYTAPTMEGNDKEGIPLKLEMIQNIL